LNNHLQSLFTCTQERWQPTIGDPHFMGWVTVAGYGVAALAALTALRHARTQHLPRAEILFWYLLCPALLMLMINKQLDIQTLFTTVARCEAQLSGWYANRRPIQIAFILGLMLLSITLLGLFSYRLRHSLNRLWLVLIGTITLLTFILVRAVGFHHVDILIGTQLAGWRLNWIIELGGITLVIMGCIYYNRKN